MANASRKCGPSFIFSLSTRLGSRGSASQHSPAVFYKILPASGDTYKTAELKFATSIPVDSRTTYKLDIEILSYFFFYFCKLGMHENTCASSSENQLFFTKAGHCKNNEQCQQIHSIEHLLMCSLKFKVFKKSSRYKLVA